MKNKYYFNLFVVADGSDSNRLTERFSPLLERNNLSAALHQSFYYTAVMAQIFAEILHLLEQFLALVECEFALAVCTVQQLILSEIFNKKVIIQLET